MATRIVSRSSSNKSGDECVMRTKLYSDFDVGETLGKGGFGQIVQAKHRCDENEYAIKIINFESHTEDAGKYTREVEVLSQLNHNNIVRYYNSWTETALVPSVRYKQIKHKNKGSLLSEIKEILENGYMINVAKEVEYNRYKSTNAEESDNGGDSDYIDENKGESEDSFVTFRHPNSEVEDKSVVTIGKKEKEFDTDYNEDSDDNEDDDDDENQVKEVKYLFIQMELCEKRTLRTAINENLYQNENLLTKYFREICEGLLYIHQRNIAHRDLKPENIFLTSEGTIKIGDFGLSKKVVIVNEAEILMSDNLPCASLTDVCGTPFYTAPELYHAKTFNTKADIYSLGVIYFEMCTKPPATAMEKAEMLSNISQQLSKLNQKQKWLVKSMTQPNYNERITCENLLKILNSEKTIDEIKQMMQENNKIPYHQIQSFWKKLKSQSIRKVDVTNFFIKETVKIFERHGSRNIDLPTFLPPFNNYSDNFTKFLSANCNSVSTSNTSRIAFSYYVAKKNITSLRRHSVGKSFEEADSLPSEFCDCIFDIVSPITDDFVNDAEILYVVTEVCDTVFTKNMKKKISFFVNETDIFLAILKLHGVTKEKVVHFTNLMDELSARLTLAEVLEFLPEKQKILAELWKGCNIATAEKTMCYSSFKLMNDQLFLRGFEKLKTITKYAEQFGIKSENIYWKPLYISENYYKGFIFKVEHKSRGILATGGRFNSLIEKLQNKETKEEVSAVGVSFVVENFVKLLIPLNPLPPILDVLICTPTKDKAIPIFRELLSRNIKCQIVDWLNSTLTTHNRPNMIITLKENDDVLVQSNKRNIIRNIYEGSWKMPNFFNLFSDK